MLLAANAFRRREFMIRSPGQQPSLHVFMANVMAGIELAFGLGHFSQELLHFGFIAVRSHGY